MSAVRPLTDLMVRNQMNALRRLLGMLQTDGIRNRDEFGDMVSAAFNHGGLELRRLSDDLGFSFSTVFRWQEGRSAPHQSLWPTIVTWVTGALAQRIEELEQTLSSEAQSECV